MTLSHTARLASALVIVAFINASYSGEAPPADPLRDEIKQLAALRVGDHAATILETQDAFDALLTRYADTPLDQVRLVDFYFQDILLRRRQHVPLPIFRAVAERGDALIQKADGDAALQARFQLFPLWIPVDLEVFVERARALLAATRDQPEPWPEQRREVWRRLIQSLWDRPERRGDALTQFAAMAEAESDAKLYDGQRAALIRRFLYDFKARDLDPGAFLDAMHPLMDVSLRPLNEQDRRGAWTQLARIANQAERFDDALTILASFEPVFHPATAVRIETLARMGRWDDLEALANQRLTWSPGSPAAFSALQAWAEAEAERGEQAKSEGLARLLWDVALTDADIDRASQTLANILMRRPDPASVTTALAAHADAGGEAAVPRATGLAFQATLKKQATETYAQDGMFPERTLAWLYAGEPDEALKTALLAYRSLDTSPKGLEQDIRLVAAALRAQSGGMAAPRAFLLYQLHGPNGPDGKPNTPDDLQRPALPSPNDPPARLHAAHRRMAGVFREEAFDGAFLNELVDYATVLSLTGDAEGALGVARSAYAWARNRGEMDKAVTAVIAALRAFDGNLIRANQCLQFQIHGPAGPDKEIGTADDLKDPFAGVALALPAAYAKELARLRNLAEQRGNWRTLGHVYLLQGQPKEAVAAYLKARPGMMVNADRATAHLTDLLAARKAADGHPFHEKAVMDFFRFGENGLDGQPGTEDDLTDPLADLK